MWGGGGYILHTTNGGTYVAVQPISNMIPENFKLFQNYPNPFNNQTVIEFEVTETSRYNLEIFNIVGQKVEGLINELIYAGKYSLTYNVMNLASGTYFYKLSSAKYSQTKKLIVIK